MKRSNKLVENKSSLELICSNNTINPLNNVNELAMVLAHEIKNPLTTIKGFLQLLKPELLDKSKAEYVDIAVDEIDRVNLIINNFLNGKKSVFYMQKEKVSINDLVKKIYKFYESEANIKNIKLTTSLMIENILVSINEHEIRQVLINLIKNAMEAIEECEKKDGVISLSTNMTEQHVFIHVLDNGCGISNEIINNLFTPFFTTKDSGTGIGLSVCKELINHNDGNIFVTSIKNKGTKITIELPI